MHQNAQKKQAETHLQVLGVNVAGKAVGLNVNAEVSESHTIRFDQVSVHHASVCHANLPVLGHDF
jgi:hypothetical protein